MNRPRSGYVLFCLGALLALACHDAPTPERVVLDVVSGFSQTQVGVESRSILPGSPEGRRHLGDGWWNQSESRGEESFVWSLGATSTVVFELTEVRPLPLRLDGRPLAVPGAPPQVVTLVVNGHVAGHHQLPPNRSVIETTIAPELLRLGPNEMNLRYAYVTSPADVDSTARDTRKLGVAWYGFHFAGGGLSPPHKPRIVPERSLLFIPNGAEVEVFADLPTSSTLAVDQWVLRGSQTGSLDVLVQPAGSPSELLARIDERHQPTRIELPGQGVSRLVLRARRQPEDNSGVTMVGARLVAPPLSPKTEPSTSPPPGPTAKIKDCPNVLIYLIDTLRADHLGIYGYQRPVSPFIDAWAQTAVVFEHAVAQSSWTKPSVASILTGLGPLRHGANSRTDTLSADALMLSERLQQAGYATAAIVTNPNITSDFGFNQGYDMFIDLGEEARAQAVVDETMGWLDAREAGRDEPFFLYLHTIDPHAPYSPPEAFRERLAPHVSASTARQSMAIVDGLQAGRVDQYEDATDQMRALYDAEIATNDAAFGSLLQGLQARGFGDDTVIVLVSDHGEEFGEHGNFQHGRALHRESLHVPLIVQLPGQTSGHRVARRVQHVDIAPTVLEAIDLPRGDLDEGTSLLPLIMDESPSKIPGTRIFSYLHLDGPARASVYEKDWKLIHELAAGAETLIKPRLYHLPADPLESEEVAAVWPVRSGYLATLLRTWLTTPEPRLEGEEAVLDSELRERLRALGYLD